MLERQLQIKDSVFFYACTHNIPEITPEEIESLRKILAILEPFQEIIGNLKDTKSCISSVIPLIHALKQTLQIEKEKTDTNLNVKNLMKKITEDINVKFCDLENNILYSLATYLDPRYKLKFFNEIVKEKVIFELLRLLKLHESSLASGVDEASTSKRPRPESDSMDEKPGTIFQTVKTVNANLTDLLKYSSDEEEDSGPKINVTSSNSLMKWKSLIKEYNNEKRLKLNEDPLLWWRYNARFHDFAPIVRTVLSPPPVSVSSEELFNDAGLRHDVENRLESEKTAKLLFVKYNLYLIKDS